MRHTKILTLDPRPSGLKFEAENERHNWRDVESKEETFCSTAVFCEV